jgi:hypothetical protein
MQLCQQYRKENQPMDREAFDGFTRAILVSTTRRRFGGMLTALGLGSVAGASLLGAVETDAKTKKIKKKRRQKRKRKQQSEQPQQPQQPEQPQQPGGQPSCVPSCTGRACGPDGCGGSCGTCQLPFICAADGSGQCVTLVLPLT